jgi:hypothetical protein
LGFGSWDLGFSPSEIASADFVSLAMTEGILNIAILSFSVPLKIRGIKGVISVILITPLGEHSWR